VRFDVAKNKRELQKKSHEADLEKVRERFDVAKNKRELQKKSHEADLDEVRERLDAAKGHRKTQKSMLVANGLRDPEVKTRALNAAKAKLMARFAVSIPAPNALPPMTVRHDQTKL
jgi:hypothetical protein